MYKIKDNINLKELEKFGFKFIDGMLVPRYKRGRIRIYYDIDIKLEMPINIINEVRSKHKMILYYNRVLYIEKDNGEEILIEDYDNDVFDLIKADIVEKVIQE